MDLSAKGLEKYIYIVVIVVVLFTIIANTLPTLQASGNLINATGVTLGSLFASNGVLWMILLAVVFLAVIRGLLGSSKK